MLRTLGVAAVGAVLVVLPACVPGDRGPVAWSTSHESSGLEHWSSDGGGGIFTSGRATATTSHAVAHTGDTSAQLQIVADGTGDSGARLFRWRESRQLREAYYGAWFYFPGEYQAPDWWNVFQFKSRTATRNDPVWILNVGNRPGSGAMHLYLYYWLTDGPRPGEPGRRSFEQAVANLPVRRWTHIEVYLKQSSAYDGRIVVWQDNKKLFDLDGVRTRYAESADEWSVNNYAQRLVPSTATIYVDDASVRRRR
jgi:hypothetical protein